MLPGVCDRTFRRYQIRYEDEGMEGLADLRLGQVLRRNRTFLLCLDTTIFEH